MFVTKRQTSSLPVLPAPTESTRDGVDVDEQQRPHGLLLPRSIRALICGPSSSGKTTVLYNLLTHPQGLGFEKLYVCCPTTAQTKYRLLKSIVEDVDGMTYREFSDPSELPPPEVGELENTILVFDDIGTDKQVAVRQYFSRGRHYGVDTFLLAQTYNAVPKHYVRDNANFIILFRCDSLNLERVHREHAGTDVAYDTFAQMCEDCWNRDKYGFLVIDKNSASGKGRYRYKFDQFFEETP